LKTSAGGDMPVPIKKVKVTFKCECSNSFEKEYYIDRNGALKLEEFYCGLCSTLRRMKKEISHG